MAELDMMQSLEVAPSERQAISRPRIESSPVAMHQPDLIINLRNKTEITYLY